MGQSGILRANNGNYKNVMPTRTKSDLTLTFAIGLIRRSQFVRKWGVSVGV